MENYDEVLKALNDFNEITPSLEEGLPSILEDYFKQVSKSGATHFAWNKIKNAFKHKLECVMATYEEEFPITSNPVLPNVENLSFDEMADRMRAYIADLVGIPFTIQRICELMVEPRKHYTKTGNFLRGIEKTLNIIATVDTLGNSENAERKYTESELTCISKDSWNDRQDSQVDDILSDIQKEQNERCMQGFRQICNKADSTLDTFAEDDIPVFEETPVTTNGSALLCSHHAIPGPDSVNLGITITTIDAACISSTVLIDNEATSKALTTTSSPGTTNPTTSTPGTTNSTTSTPGTTNSTTSTPGTTTSTTYASVVASSKIQSSMDSDARIGVEIVQQSNIASSTDEEKVMSVTTVGEGSGVSVKVDGGQNGSTSATSESSRSESGDESNAESSSLIKMVSGDDITPESGIDSRSESSTGILKSVDENKTESSMLVKCGYESLSESSDESKLDPSDITPISVENIKPYIGLVDEGESITVASVADFNKDVKLGENKFEEGDDSNYCGDNLGSEKVASVEDVTRVKEEDEEKTVLDSDNISNSPSNCLPTSEPKLESSPRTPKRKREDEEGQESTIKSIKISLD